MNEGLAESMKNEKFLHLVSKMTDSEFRCFTSEYHPNTFCVSHIHIILLQKYTGLDIQERLNLKFEKLSFFKIRNVTITEMVLWEQTTERFF